MRNQLFKILIAIFLLLSCNTAEMPMLSIAEADFDWLEGNWIRSNEVEGKRTYEIWRKVEDDIYKGIGITMLDIDTVFYEEMTIHNQDSTWVLEINGINDSTTVFSITEIDDYGFKSFCPENEFPTIISYHVDGENLKAVISDGKTEIDFKFEPNENQEL